MFVKTDTVFMEYGTLYAGVDYNLTLFRLQSRLQQIYHGQPYARVDLNPMQELTLSPSKGLRIWPLGSRIKDEKAYSRKNRQSKLKDKNKG